MFTIDVVVVMLALCRVGQCTVLVLECNHLRDNRNITYTEEGATEAIFLGGGMRCELDT